METLSSPQGSFNLQRYPVRQKETLRAWDAADEYLLQTVAEQQPAVTGQVLIMNDSFGALSCALADLSPLSVSDSFIAQQGTSANLALNQIPADQVTLLNSLQPLATPGTKFDLVIIKITKSLAQLEDQLHRLRPYLNEQSLVIAGGMVKGIHTSTLKLFETLIGPTHTSLARKKARLIFSEPDLHLQPPANSYPKTYQLEGTQYQITNHANVFSREKLDIGTRFFIQNLPDDNRYQDIVDLGCGNGIVGLLAAEKNPDATIHFVDESFMAVASARENFQRAQQDRTADFRVTDCLQGFSPVSCDLILNNPPFHQQSAVGDFIAWQMFKESHTVLRQSGELWVIGNRHLGYHVKLKRLFGNCQTVASNKKFVILKAIKR
ncbi:MAG: methyltransferase [Amphritea sp.]|nr:methyltransferase [Amphritea sp.]